MYRLVRVLYIILHDIVCFIIFNLLFTRILIMHTQRITVYMYNYLTLVYARFRTIIMRYDYYYYSARDNRDDKPLG